MIFGELFLPPYIRCECSSWSFQYSFLLVECCGNTMDLLYHQHLKKKKCPDTFRITVFLPLIPLLFEKLKTLSKIKSDVVKSFYLNFLSGLVI